MASAIHKLVCTVGLVSLAHVAYSAAQHRTYMRLTEQEFTALPADVLVQGIVSLIMLMHSISHISGEFKDIKVGADLDTKSWESVGNRPSFYSFHHRGKALFGRQQVMEGEESESSRYCVVAPEHFPSAESASIDGGEEDEDEDEDAEEEEEEDD
ncbi:PREDICTED: membrane magnesium transporter 1-like [Priapulus caudatus]|uniref:Membrane magnesium transporter n=1 Tax=Priapulus caudatus TaxID=37621 RepID=A0ABM1F0P0_PRICU|nr:PREDICTED: membrane magnesium transporter 1-like [Priapulus caudatus]XP_014678011.1 PREDICTED: membrane magnesium transporter 1-like [Priapulus caudatus]